MLQKFHANPNSRRENANGSVGYGSGSSFDCLGPYAKVIGCPIRGTSLRRTVYATGYADSFFSIPAATRIRGKYVGGFLTETETGPEFVPYDRFKDRIPAET